MYICLHCGHNFDEPHNRYNRRWSDSYDSEQYCPNCGSEDFEEAEKCEKCGEWHSSDKVENGVCEDCIDKASTVPNAFAYGDKNKWCVELNGFLAWAFTPDEINSILLNELMKNKDLANQYAREYCKDDTWSFADYLKKEEDK